MKMSLTVVAEDAEERQLLVSEAGASTVIRLDDLDSPTSSGFVSGSHRDDDDIDDFEERDFMGPDAVRCRTKYKELLERSQTTDLLTIEETNCFFHSGYDKQGRAVIVFIGKWFKQNQIDLEKALLYLIKILEPLAGHDYVVVYFHTRTSRENIPSYWWIKEVYNTVPYKYKKNLKAFYVVHPTMWTKMTCWWFSTFMAPAIKNKIHNVHSIEELKPVVNEKDLGIPMFITEQDMVLNGIRVYEP